MANTSATGGYLLPLNTAVEDVALRRYLHGVIAGVTGLDDTLVRAGFQKNPPPMPPASEDWVAYYEVSRESANLPQIVYNDAESYTLFRTERMTYLCSFYGDNSQAFAYNFRDGMYVAQNRENMLLNGFVLHDVQDGIYLPQLINNIYIQRTDIRFSFDRVISRNYAILTLQSAQIELNVKASAEDLQVIDINTGS